MPHHYLTPDAKHLLLLFSKPNGVTNIGSGFYITVNVDGAVHHGILTNNHLIQSLTEARQTTATFGFDKEGKEDVKVRLKPDVIFRTDKVGSFHTLLFYRFTVVHF